MKTAAIVKMKKGWPLLLLAVSTALSLAALGEEIRPASSPATPATPATQPMDKSYDVLLTFSIFSRDHKPALVIAPATRPADTVTILGEANFILRGVGVADGRPTAFFEQTTDQQITKIHLGDPLLHGIITEGSLDGVDYVVDGKASHIMIGQALDGGIPVSSAPVPSDPNSATHKWAHSHHQD